MIFQQGIFKIKKRKKTMKIEYKKALFESIPYMIVLGVIGLGLYLNALIVQDTITLLQAQIIGYVLLTAMIGLEIFSLIMLKIFEIERRILQDANEVKDKKIEELEKELVRIQNS